MAVRGTTGAAQPACFTKGGFAGTGGTFEQAVSRCLETGPCGHGMHQVGLVIRE